MIYVWIGIIVFFAGAVQGLSGFGSALVAMSLLPFVIGIEQAVPFVAVNAIIISSINLHSVKEHFDMKDFRRLLCGAVVGTPLGIAVLLYIDPVITKKILGGLIICYSLYSLVGKPTVNIDLKAFWGYIAGLFSGILGGAFTINGPPVIIYLSMKHHDKHKIKSTTAGYFLAGGIVIISMYILNGLYTSTVVSYCVYFVPVTAVGVLIGNHFDVRPRAHDIRRMKVPSM